MRRASSVWGIVALFALVMVVGVHAQAPAAKPEAVKADAAKVDAPVVSEVDALRLDKLLLRQQNLALQMASLQADLQRAQEEAPKLKAEVERFIAGLQKPGYTLQGDGKGGYVYVVKPPEAEKAETPAPAPATKK